MPPDDCSCIILAGGFGTRLKSVVSDRPKVLAPVNGLPFLHYLIEQVANAGIRHVVLSTGFMADLVAETFGERHGAVELSYAREEQALGTGGATRYAFDLCHEGPVLVMNGDSYCGVDIPAHYAAHVRNGGLGSLALTRVADASRYGTVALDAAGIVTAFLEKTAGTGEGLINAGVYWLEPELIRGIAPGQAVSLERDVFPNSPGSLFGYIADGAFIDIGTPESYLEAAGVLAGKTA